MLETESSVYYDLVHDVITHTDKERLVTFGMNLGYNSCTLGAQRIRNSSEAEHINIPWSVILHLDADHYLVHQEQYKQAITQGEEMGIYTWQFITASQPELFLPLVSEHPDSAFILFCNPDEITAEFLDDAAELNNLMLTVHYREESAELFETMRDMGFLYSVYYIYSPDDVESILNGDLFYSIQQANPVFTALTADSTCSRQTQIQVYDSIKKLRDSQCLQTVPWEMLQDCSFINEIISSKAYSVVFGADGTLYMNCPECSYTGYNLFDSDLKIIFQQLNIK